MSSLRNKAIKGASWSLIERILQYSSKFIFGIILARFLMPSQYGLVAMAMVFISYTYVFVESGFSSAIIQKRKLSNADLSTVFYLNLAVSILAYLVLFFSAYLISDFYNEPKLVKIIRYLSFIIIFYAISIVQNSLLKREINFKLLARIRLISNVSSSLIAIYLAYNGFGVWALVWRTLLNQLFINIQLWLSNNWFPTLEFDSKSFKKLFSFSSKLLLGGIFERIYREIYKLIIGKYYPSEELGLFTRAEQFKNLPTRAFSGSLLSFLLPVFSKLQDNNKELKRKTIKIVKIVMFFNILALCFLAVTAKPLILVLLGDKWSGTIIYIQMLSLVGLFFPLHAISVQLLTSKGRTDLVLKRELLSKFFGIPAILLAIFVSIKTMIIGMILAQILLLLLEFYYTNQLMEITLKDIFSNIYKTIILAVLLCIILFPIIYFINGINNILMLTIIFFTGFTIIILSSSLLNMDELREIKIIFLSIINSKTGKK